jgi:hypothetical protein
LNAAISASFEGPLEALEVDSRGPTNALAEKAVEDRHPPSDVSGSALGLLATRGEASRTGYR